MIKGYQKILLKLALLILALLAFLPEISLAAVPTWQLVPKESSIKFTATQNDAPVSGQFKLFNAEINFDIDQLNDSKIKIVVDLNSIIDPYNQIATTLKDKDWFNIKVFPQAIFQSTKFIKTGAKTYRVEGMLQIRDKCLPVNLDFTQILYSSTKAQMKGSTTLKRTLFGVGQGEWADTKSIKDKVQVNFIITATK